MAKGKLFVFEGIDGSGKSTQFDLLCQRLLSESIEFKRLRFPRYDKPSSALVKMYLGGELGDTPNAVNPYAASSFYAVDRYASFLEDWRGYYNKGGLVLTDRYTTSNALHHGAKLPEENQEEFFRWLYEYEFDFLDLPKPNLVIFFDIEAEIAARRLEKRQDQTGERRDIHEMDIDYLKECALTGRKAAKCLKWKSIHCSAQGNDISEEELHELVYDLVLRRAKLSK